MNSRQLADIKWFSKQSCNCFTLNHLYFNYLYKNIPDGVRIIFELLCKHIPYMVELNNSYKTHNRDRNNEIP